MQGVGGGKEGNRHVLERVKTHFHQYTDHRKDNHQEKAQPKVLVTPNFATLQIMWIILCQKQIDDDENMIMNLLGFLMKS